MLYPSINFANYERKPVPADKLDTVKPIIDSKQCSDHYALACAPWLLRPSRLVAVFGCSS